MSKAVKKSGKCDVVYVASVDSFPCSDPPGWIKVHACTCGECDDHS